MKVSVDVKVVGELISATKCTGKIRYATKF